MAHLSIVCDRSAETLAALARDKTTESKMNIEITRDMSTEKGAMLVSFEHATDVLHASSISPWGAFSLAMKHWTEIATELQKRGWFREGAALFRAKEPLPKSRSLTLNI
jgi:hypothetical protein